MKNNKIYIILFIILYVFVALVSGIHGFAFFGLANTPLLAIMLAIAFEIGQAAVLFSILTDGSQRKKVMPWFLMGILTLVQIMGNVYNSYKYLITNAEANLRFFKEPIFIWTDIPDAQANVILSYVQGAILPLVALLLTSMVAGFLNKKDEPEIEYEEVEEEQIEEPQDEKIIENEQQEEPKEEIEKDNEINNEEVIEDIPQETIEKITETNQDKKDIEKKEKDDEEILKEPEEKPIEFPHEIINENSKKSHLINF